MYEETYTFYLSGADGLKLKINGQNVIGTFANTDLAWEVRPYLETGSNFLPLTRIFNVSADQVSTKIPIQIDFYSIGVTEWSKLDDRGIKFESESNNQIRQVVPKTQLYPNNNVVTSVNFIKDNSGVSFYPNPASNQLTVDGGPLIIEEIKIINAQGQVVYQSNESFVGNKSINLNSFSSGFYSVSIISENIQITKKLIIQ